MKATGREGKGDLQETTAGADQEWKNEVGERVGLRHGGRSCEHRLLGALRGSRLPEHRHFTGAKRFPKKDN